MGLGIQLTAPFYGDENSLYLSANPPGLESLDVSRLSPLSTEANANSPYPEPCSCVGRAGAHSLLHTSTGRPLHCWCSPGCNTPPPRIHSHLGGPGRVRRSPFCHPPTPTPRLTSHFPAHIAIYSLGLVGRPYDKWLKGFKVMETWAIIPTLLSPALWPSVSYLTFLGFGFPICETDRTIATS